jgi:hypothetical protein
MTKERRTTIMILIGTLLVGILLGLLIPGFFHKYHGGARRYRDRATEDTREEWFAHTIMRIVQPDSLQAQRIKPITDWAAQEIEAVETSSNARMSEILDSVKINLAPILTTEQNGRLDEFKGRAQRRWKGEGTREGNRR